MFGPAYRLFSKQTIPLIVTSAVATAAYFQLKNLEKTSEEEVSRIRAQFSNCRAIKEQPVLYRGFNTKHSPTQAKEEQDPITVSNDLRVAVAYAAVRGWSKHCGISAIIPKDVNKVRQVYPYSNVWEIDTENINSHTEVTFDPALPKTHYRLAAAFYLEQDNIPVTCS